MKMKTKLLVAAIALAGATQGQAEILQSNDGHAGPLTMAVFGDSPYSNVAADYTQNPPNETSEFDASPAFIEAINKDNKVKLVLFAGDIHSGKQPCTFAYDKAIYNLWTQFKAPLIYTPGDNEWTDCHKGGEGGNVNVNGTYIDYANGDPVANLGLVRQIFFSNPGQALGGHHQTVVSQADAYDPAHPADAEYVENVMWEQAGVLFVSVNIPGGSNNDGDAWYGAPITGEQLQEAAERTAADIRWLDAAFAQAKADHVAGVLILTQADMWDIDGNALGTAHLTNYDGLISDIATNTTNFGNPVLLFNGDSHKYRSDNPLVSGAPCVIENGTSAVQSCASAGLDDADAWATHPALSAALNVPNFHRVVVHGSTFPLEYLRVAVDAKHPPAPGPNSFGPFSWTRIQP